MSNTDNLVPEWATGVIDTTDKMITIDRDYPVTESDEWIQFQSRGQMRRIMINQVMWFVGATKR